MKPEGDAPVYVISVAAKLAGLPAWMLRVLDQEGIVVPTRTEKNRRLYSDNDIARLERVRYLTEERSVNLAGVRVILEMEEAGALPDGRMPEPPEAASTPITHTRHASEETEHDLSRR